VPQLQRRPAAGDTEPPGAAIDLFLQLSIVLTGFEEHVLRGTGMLQPYYDELLRVIGAREAGALLSAFEKIAHRKHGAFDRNGFQKDFLKDSRFGPVARSVITMWYLGVWMQLPREWRDERGATAYDTDHTVSAAAYRESLVWPAAGAHPMSAKAPGFGSWANPSTLPAKTRSESGT
jgi:hypothetical protein